MVIVPAEECQGGDIVQICRLESVAIAAMLLAQPQRLILGRKRCVPDVGSLSAPWQVEASKAVLRVACQSGLDGRDFSAYLPTLKCTFASGYDAASNTAKARLSQRGVEAWGPYKMSWSSLSMERIPAEWIVKRIMPVSHGLLANAGAWPHSHDETRERER